MYTLQAIEKRRSIRKFQDKTISAEQIKTLLKAAMLAPTARNCQEWEFVVIKDRIVLNALKEVHPHAQMLSTADCAIVVCADTSREWAAGYWMGDCGAATQNILLAATDMGIGSVWLGVYPNEDRMQAIADVLQLPTNVKPFNVIALGYPDEEKEPVDRFDEKKIHYEKW
ncbi:MAG: nitroreductase family protein [Elusimicrobiaceae bacterium]|nr:nitroreductase family protein [Elusimicrobiaceae bacterium]